MEGETCGEDLLIHVPRGRFGVTPDIAQLQPWPKRRIQRKRDPKLVGYKPFRRSFPGNGDEPIPELQGEGSAQAFPAEGKLIPQPLTGIPR